MPNWCIGDLKVRGKYKDIKNFLSNELILLGGGITSYDDKPPTIIEDEYELNVKSDDKELCLKNGSKRYCFFKYDIDIRFDCNKKDKEKEDMIITTNLGELESAWDLDTEALTELSKKYNLDFKIYAYEGAMEFNIDFEVHKGEVIKDNIIIFDDYVWECTNPEIGG